MEREEKLPKMIASKRDRHIMGYTGLIIFIICIILSYDRFDLYEAILIIGMNVGLLGMILAFFDKVWAYIRQMEED